MNAQMIVHTDAEVDSVLEYSGMEVNVQSYGPKKLLLDE